MHQTPSAPSPFKSARPDINRRTPGQQKSQLAKQQQHYMSMEDEMAAFRKSTKIARSPHSHGHGQQQHRSGSRRQSVAARKSAGGVKGGRQYYEGDDEEYEIGDDQATKRETGGGYGEMLEDQDQQEDDIIDSQEPLDVGRSTRRSTISGVDVGGSRHRPIMNDEEDEDEVVDDGYMSPGQQIKQQQQQRKGAGRRESMSAPTSMRKAFQRRQLPYNPKYDSPPVSNASQYEVEGQDPDEDINEEQQQMQGVRGAGLRKSMKGAPMSEPRRQSSGYALTNTNGTTATARAAGLLRKPINGGSIKEATAIANRGGQSLPMPPGSPRSSVSTYTSGSMSPSVRRVSNVGAANSPVKNKIPVQSPSAARYGLETETYVEDSEGEDQEYDAAEVRQVQVRGVKAGMVVKQPLSKIRQEQPQSMHVTKKGGIANANQTKLMMDSDDEFEANHQKTAIVRSRAKAAATVAADDIEHDDEEEDEEEAVETPKKLLGRGRGAVAKKVPIAARGATTDAASSAKAVTPKKKGGRRHVVEDTDPSDEADETQVVVATPPQVAKKRTPRGKKAETASAAASPSVNGSAKKKANTKKANAPIADEEEDDVSTPKKSTTSKKKNKGKERATVEDVAPAAEPEFTALTDLEDANDTYIGVAVDGVGGSNYVFYDDYDGGNDFVDDNTTGDVAPMDADDDGDVDADVADVFAKVRSESEKDKKNKKKAMQQEQEKEEEEEEEEEPIVRGKGRKGQKEPASELAASKRGKASSAATSSSAMNSRKRKAEEREASPELSASPAAVSKKSKSSKKTSREQEPHDEDEDAQIKTKDEENEEYTAGGRPKRRRVPPTEYWVVDQTIKYRARKSLTTGVWGFEIEEVPEKKEKDEETLAKRKSNSHRRKASSAVVKRKENHEPLESPFISVINSKTQQEEELKLVCTPEMMNTRVLSADNKFSYQRTFQVGDFFGTGIMELPVGGEKPNKNAGRTALVNITFFFFVYRFCYLASLY
jgi:hypothetical protein